VSKKIARLNTQIAKKREIIVQKLSEFQEEVEFFTPKEKKILLNGSQLNKYSIKKNISQQKNRQIKKLTTDIISAEKEKNSLIKKQTLKRDELENNVNQLIAKKYVLEAIQLEEKEWAEKRIK
jgi:lysozyme family protein